MLYDSTYIKYKNRYNYTILSKIKIAVIFGDMRRAIIGRSIGKGVFWGVGYILSLELDYDYMCYMAIKCLLKKDIFIYLRLYLVYF